MKISMKSIFKKVIVILVTFLVGLPCAVKKDFKTGLNLSLSDLEPTEKPNKSVVCPNFLKTESKNNSVSFQKKELQKFDSNFGILPQLPEFSPINLLTFADIQVSATVPIYILHEQYLI